MTNAILQKALAKNNGNKRATARSLGIPESSLRVLLAREVPDVPDHGYTPSPDEFPDSHVSGSIPVLNKCKGKRGTVTRFILGSAQNNCEVPGQFWANLMAIAKHVNAETLISYTLYDRQNYRGILRERPERVDGIWWDKKVRPFACNQQVDLHRKLKFCGEFDLIASTPNPLSGCESYGQGSSLIVPHNRFLMYCIPNHGSRMPKELHTTGSVTRPKFIARKAGQLAWHHHVLGALLVEVVKGGHFYVHQLNADDNGDFYWLDKHVVGGRVKKSKSVAALICGDIHHEKSSQGVTATIPAISKWLKPQHVILHDLIDFTSRSHHERHKAAFRVQHVGKTVEEEIKAAGDWLRTICRAGQHETVVVRSNHDEAFDRWVEANRHKFDDADNERFWVAAWQWYLDNPNGNLLRWAVERKGKWRRQARFLSLDASYEVAGIECGIHGHAGASGSRGTPRGFGRLPFKSFTAHTHTPSIFDGAYTVGVAGDLDMGYNRGPSKWMHCHGIIYENGKRALLPVKGGDYRVRGAA